MTPLHRPSLVPGLDPDAIWTSREPGIYLLGLCLAEQATCDVGRFGQITFHPGWYVYVGSALGGLGPRLRRHARYKKPHHWHIDALREVASLLKIAVRVGRERLECTAAAHVATLPGASQPIARFGASDCRCATHLFHFA
jgi:sugar fermentation stimulation protein A